METPIVVVKKSEAIIPLALLAPVKHPKIKGTDRKNVYYWVNDYAKSLESANGRLLTLRNILSKSPNVKLK